jgi:hypothetical protein
MTAGRKGIPLHGPRTRERGSGLTSSGSRAARLGPSAGRGGLPVPLDRSRHLWTVGGSWGRGRETCTGIRSTRGRSDRLPGLEPGERVSRWSSDGGSLYIGRGRGTYKVWLLDPDGQEDALERDQDHRPDGWDSPARDIPGRTLLRLFRPTDSVDSLPRRGPEVTASSAPRGHPERVSASDLLRDEVTR